MVFESIVAGLAKFFDLFLFPLAGFPASIALIVIASALTIIVFGVNRLLVNKNAVKEIKDKIEDTREKLTVAQKAGNKEEIYKHMSNLWQTNNLYIKISMKTMIISLV